MLHVFRYLLTILVTALMLQGCGGGGGGGSTSSVPTYAGLTSEARIDTANAEDLSTASVSSALQASIASEASSLSPRSMPSHEAKVLEISPRIAQWIAISSNDLAAREVAGLCATGTATTNAADTDPVGTITFSSCGIDDGTGNQIVLTGTVDYSFNQSTDTFDMSFHVSVTYAGETAALNLTIHCVNFSNATSCMVSSDFVGLDGRIYRVTDISVFGDPSTGISVDATVYDPNHGRVTMVTTSAMVFDCPVGVPSTGTLVISGSDSTSATVSFNGCTSFDVTIAGSPATYFWP